MKNYPYLVYRYKHGFYGTKNINFIKNADASSDLEGVVIDWSGQVHDKSGNITPECRKFLREFGIREIECSMFRFCIVYGPSDCDYFEKDGIVQPSTEPPTMQIQLSEGSYDMEVLSNTYGHINDCTHTKGESNTKSGADEFFIEAMFTQLRGRAPGYILNDAQPVNDGNIYSLCRNEGDDRCWDLFQCSLTEDCNKVKVKRIFEAVHLNDVEKIIYPYLERLGIYVEDHTVVALGLPTHFPNIRAGGDATSNPGHLMAEIDYKVLAEDLRFLQKHGKHALMERVAKRKK
jgi:hypothetical protein